LEPAMAGRSLEALTRIGINLYVQIGKKSPVL
jgi:hypothetical protein